MADLNKRQQAFADEYIISGNATEAAIKAGYSEKTAYRTGADNLKKPQIREYIEGVIEAQKDERILQQKDILVMLSEIASGEAKEYKEVVTKKGEWMTNPNDKESDDPEKQPRKQLVYNERAEIIALPTRNADRVRALELLGKRYVMWTDKSEVEHSGAVQFVDDIGGEDDASTSDAPEAE